MAIDIQSFVSDTLLQTVSLFTIMNSLSAGAIMLSLLPDEVTRGEIGSIARKNTIATFIAMLVTFFVGSYLFKLMGISTDSLMVFGGIVLMLMGLNMVSGATKKLNHSKSESTAAQGLDDISVVPLSIPVIVGPGLAATLIALESESDTVEKYLSVLLAVVLVSAINWIILANMDLIKKSLGINGIKVLSRVMGLIVGSIAVQMILKGGHQLWS